MHSIFKLFRPANLQTPKLSNFENVKHSNSTSFKLSIFRNFMPSTPQSLKFFELSNFEPFELSNFQAPWVSNFQTPSSQTFELELEGFSVKPYTFSSGPSPCSLAQRVAAASNFQAGFPCKLWNSKLAPTFKLETLKHQKFKILILQTFQSLQSRPTYNTFNLKISSSKNPTPDSSHVKEPTFQYKPQGSMYP